MKHIDLFSGIGGNAIGLEREGFETVAFCELDAGCRAVLGRHWPGVPTYGDITDHRGQPLSGSVGSWQAGRALGLAELFDARADWVVVENVQHTWRRWVPELRERLHRIGYASVCVQVSAAEVGGSHERRRAFVIAHTHSEPLRELSRWWCREGRQVADELASTWDSAPRRLGTDDGLPNWPHRRHALGNAVVPRAMQLIGRAIMRAALNSGEQHAIR